MERKTISPDAESRLAGAIEKAATIASSKDNCDVNRTLADCLLERDVDSRFAKVASAGFNRRLTVLKFQKSDDSHRADTFGLSDSDTVLEIMGGKVDGQKKTASEQLGGFKMELVSAAPMEKAASAPAKAPYIRYENRVTVPVFERHLESIMDKQASDFGRLLSELKMMEDSIERRKREVAGELTKVASFELSTLCNVFGERLANAMEGVVPKDMKLKKTASAIDPETRLSHKVARLLDDIDTYVQCNDLMCDYKQWLGDFASAAAKTSKALHKTAGVSTLAGMTTRGLSAAGLTGIQALNSIREATNESLDNGMSSVKSIYDALGPYKYSPAEVLSPEFVTRDRFQDRMMAVSDMWADPLIAQYPSYQTFLATNKAMDLNPALESPANREVLKGEVEELLTSNNRRNKANIAASTAILASLAKAPASVYNQALSEVSGEDSKSAPELPAALNLMSILNSKLSIGDKDFMGRATADNIRAAEQAAKENEAMSSSRVKALEAGKRTAEQPQLEGRKADKESLKTLIETAGKVGLKIKMLNPVGAKSPVLVFEDPSDPTLQYTPKQVASMLKA